MKKHLKNYSIEELLLNESFQNYCLGSNEEDEQMWQQWMRVNEERKELVQQAKNMYFLLNGNLSKERFQKDRQTFRNTLSEHITNQQNIVNASNNLSRKKIIKMIWVSVSGVAACFIICVLFLLNKPESKPIQLAANHVYSEICKQGEKKMFKLEDGTKVILNAGSSLTVSEDFNQNKRVVTLVGEAFFDVAHNKDKPFIIETPVMNVKVLGTVFNVKAYPADKTLETLLLKGSVEVTLKNDTAHKILLHPNEKIILRNPAATGNVSNTLKQVNSTDNEFKIVNLTTDSSNNLIPEVSWTHNQLAFNDNNFEEIAHVLERWYNVTIVFNEDSIKDYRFTATFQGKTAEEVLNALQMSRYFNYQITKEKIIIMK